jgi:hypothetical protein
MDTSSSCRHHPGAHHPVSTATLLSPPLLLLVLPPLLPLLPLLLLQV